MSSAFELLNRRTERAPVNPMDKCTVVSLFPREIDEVKHTISPGRFIVPPGSLSKPGILHVGPSSWWRELDYSDPKQGLFEISQNSILIAKSVVTDWLQGLPWCNQADRMPAVFYLEGEWSVAKILSEKKTLLEAYDQKQKNWYMRLVEVADGIFAATNGNPRAIMDDMKLAAQQLGLDKPWLKNLQASTMVRCVACGALRNPEFPICGACHLIIDKPLYEKLGLGK